MCGKSVGKKSKRPMELALWDETKQAGETRREAVKERKRQAVVRAFEVRKETHLQEPHNFY